MNRKKIISAVCLVLLAGLLLNFALTEKKDTVSEQKYITDRNDSVKLEDARLCYKKINFNENSAKEYFSEEVVNRYTIKYFRSLQRKFKEMSFEDHLEAVRSCFFSSMSSDDAEKLFDLYKKYLQYQKDMAAKIKDWGTPKNPLESLKMLQRMKQYQTDIFGEEASAILFGASLKAREYSIRRKAIIFNKDLYGKEKEEKISKLDKDMWGDEASAVGNHVKPFNRYKEKMNIYQNDLKDMTPEMKSAKVKEFRKEIFSSEQIARLENVDRVLAEEKQREAEYQSEKEIIENDTSLTAEEKDKQITDLQQKKFGKENAGAAARRENIRKAIKERSKL